MLDYSVYELFYAVQALAICDVIHHDNHGIWR